MPRLLGLVEQGDGIILVADVALAVLVAQQPVGSEPEFPGPFAGAEEDRRRQVGPVELALQAKPIEELIEPSDALVTILIYITALLETVNLTELVAKLFATTRSETQASSEVWTKEAQPVKSET